MGIILWCQNTFYLVPLLASGKKEVLVRWILWKLPSVTLEVVSLWHFEPSGNVSYIRIWYATLLKRLMHFWKVCCRNGALHVVNNSKQWRGLTLRRVRPADGTHIQNCFRRTAREEKFCRNNNRTLVIGSGKSNSTDLIANWHRYNTLPGTIFPFLQDLQIARVGKKSLQRMACIY